MQHVEARTTQKSAVRVPGRSKLRAMWMLMRVQGFTMPFCCSLLRLHPRGCLTVLLDTRDQAPTYRERAELLACTGDIVKPPAHL
jgi:hypothetical protein